MPLALTTSGFLLLPTPSTSFSSYLNVMGASGTGGSTGMGVASGFYITGFGMSFMMIGNSTGYPGLGVVSRASSTNGTNANLSVSMIVGSGDNAAGGATIVSRNPPAQSLPPSPGSGFRYIGPPAGSGAALATPMPANQDAPRRPNAPVSPVAPMGPRRPSAVGPGRIIRLNRRVDPERVRNPAPAE